MPWWSGLPKTFVEGTKAKASEVNENFNAVREALLYLLSEEEVSPFPQLKEAAKRILTMASNVVLLDSSGRSDFMKLVSGGPYDRQIHYGVATVGSGAADGYSDVGHQLGVEPYVVVAVHKGGTFQVNCTTANYQSSTFRLYAYRVDGAELGEVTCAWIAIG